MIKIYLIFFFYFRYLNDIVKEFEWMKIMNKNKSDMYILMYNFEILKIYFKIYCVRFLGNILEQWYYDIENIKKSEIFGLFNEYCQEEIVK